MIVWSVDSRDRKLDARSIAMFCPMRVPAQRMISEASFSALLPCASCSWSSLQYPRKSRWSHDRKIFDQEVCLSGLWRMWPSVMTFRVGNSLGEMVMYLFEKESLTGIEPDGPEVWRKTQPDGRVCKWPSRWRVHYSTKPSGFSSCDWWTHFISMNWSEFVYEDREIIESPKFIRVADGPDESEASELVWVETSTKVPPEEKLALVASHHRSYTDSGMVWIWRGIQILRLLEEKLMNCKTQFLVRQLQNGDVEIHRISRFYRKQYKGTFDFDFPSVFEV